jgi:hypothetical protein
MASGTGDKRLDKMGDIVFEGAIGKQIAAYGLSTQKFGHDLAAELEEAARLAGKAIRQLDGHPLLLGIDLRLRARVVTRHLRRGAELARETSGEAVKFTLAYRREFLAIQDAGTKARQGHSRYNRKVDL